MSFDLIAYRTLTDAELRTAAAEFGIEYQKTGSAIVWLAKCVKDIADKISDMDDDVDALWTVACGDVPSPAEFSSEEGKPRFAASGFQTECHGFASADPVNVKNEPQAEPYPNAKVIHTFPEGEKATGANAFHINGQDRVFFSTNLNIYELIDSKLYKVSLANA